MGNPLRLQNYDFVGEYPESEDVWFKATGSEEQIIGRIRGEVGEKSSRRELFRIENYFREQAIHIK
jgi:hypothetical protein